MTSTFLGALQCLRTLVAIRAQTAEFTMKREAERLAGPIEHVRAEAAR